MEVRLSVYCRSSCVTLGAAGMAVGQPFDTVKVGLRGSHVYMHNTSSSQARLQTDGLLDGKKTYRGAYHCFSHIVKHEGVRKLPHISH